MSFGFGVGDLGFLSLGLGLWDSWVWGWGFGIIGFKWIHTDSEENVIKANVSYLLASKS